MIDPLFEYDHTQGASISGGTIYRGDDIPWLYVKYAMTDYTSREIFVGDPAPGELLKAEVAESEIPVIRNPVTVAAARDDL